MVGGKKYNIWIAYSDLFTNLSVFLFISAAGLFAAIGSGRLAIGGFGATEPCSIPKMVQQSLEADGSLVRRIGTGVRRRGSSGRCTEYYIVRDFRFRTTESSSFADRNHRPPSWNDLQLRICQPIWLTLAAEHFERAEGRITLVGIAQSNDGAGYPASCGARRGDDRPHGFPRGRQPIFVISDCRLRGPSAYRICGRVLECLAVVGPDDRSSWCRSVWAVEERARQADAVCRRVPAREQAKTLYYQCEGAIDSSFPDQKFEQAGMRAISRRPEGRYQIWGGETDFESVTRDMLSRALPANHPLSNQPAGSILVQVQYGG